MTWGSDCHMCGREDCSWVHGDCCEGRVKALSADRDRLERANKARPDYDLYCDECGRAHILDTVLPSNIWNQVAEPGDLLCAVCIDKRLAAAGLECNEAEFYYAGSALSSRLYEDSHGEVSFQERRATKAEARCVELEGLVKEAMGWLADEELAEDLYDRMLAALNTGESDDLR